MTRSLWSVKRPNLPKGDRCDWNDGTFEDERGDGAVLQARLAGGHIQAHEAECKDDYEYIAYQEQKG